jgi:hypothetical protein
MDFGDLRVLELTVPIVYEDCPNCSEALACPEHDPDQPFVKRLKDLLADLRESMYCLLSVSFFCVHFP